MNRRLSTPLFLGLGAFVVAASACGEGGTEIETGRLSVLLTDAPGDILQAWVNIDRIEVVGGQDEAEAEAEENTPVVLREDDVITDLLTLRDDVASLVTDAVVPAGFYAQLRFVIPAACIEVEVSDTESAVYSTSEEFLECGTPVGTLRTTSFSESGLKVKLPGGSIEVTDDLTVLLVDFDVALSFGHQAGQSGAWVMHPVVKVTTM